MDAVIADIEIRRIGGITQINAILQLYNGIHGVVVDIGADRIVRIDTGKILRVGGTHLLDMVIGNRTIRIACIYTSVT